MNIQDWGAVGEIVGAIGVIVTLIYLAVEVRKNTVALRQQTYNDIVTRHGEWLDYISSDRDRMKLFMDGVSGGRLDHIDSQRFTNTMLKIMSHFQDLHLQYEAGIVEDVVWESQCRFLGALVELPGFKNWWPEAKQYFSPELWKVVEMLKPTKLVQYDEESGTWGRPGGAFRRSSGNAA